MTDNDGFINTSYLRDYIVVSASSNEVVLRPVDADDSIPTYWKEFLGISPDDPMVDPGDVPTIHLNHLPSEVFTTDAYTDYTIEYPSVYVTYKGKVYDISDRISCNHPNPETPGLYAIDFMLSLSGERGEVVWRSWVSIEEPPILRHIITPWNKTNRVVADLNRLVIEPQYMEALYEAGVPVYNFMQANANSAVPQGSILRYRDARAFIVNKKLFISGGRLPTGTDIALEDGGVKRTIGLKLLTPEYDIHTHYEMGDIATYCGSDYYALEDIPITDGKNIIPDVTVETEDGYTKAYWLSGTYYDVEDIDLPDGEYKLEYIWSVIDVDGYLFKMDLLRAFQIRHYWGCYNKKYFLDYAPGDLVSIVSNNVISLYQRNETSLDDASSEELYRPGHYKNPHWVEVYSESNNSLLRDPAIRPYTNAVNAIVSKTYPVREEAFRIYAKLVGMPVQLVDGLGPKYSVLLWALLYRTRETYPGFKAAINAIGLDVKDLHRVYPSVLYSQFSGDTETEIKDIYTEIDKVKIIAKSIQADKIWYGGDTNPLHTGRDEDADDIPWIRYTHEHTFNEQTDTGTFTDDTVWVFNKETEQWEKFYSFNKIGSDTAFARYDYTVNNRYYKAEVALLDRLKADIKIDLNDDIDWIDQNAFGSLSEILVQLLRYEIPIYIYLRLIVHLAAIGNAKIKGISNGVALHDAWGGFIGLKLYPGKVFDLATMSVRYFYPKLQYSYTKPDSFVEWIDYTDYTTMEQGYRFYPFNKAVYLKIFYDESETGLPVNAEDSEESESKWWISQFTIGCLGDSESEGTNDTGFTDATEMPNDAEYIYLCKGIAACTLRIATTTLDARAEGLQWKYQFDTPYDGESGWSLEMPEDNPYRFAEWGDIDCTMYGVWFNRPQDLRDALYDCTSTDGDVTWAWDESEPILYIGKRIPRTVYLWNKAGYIIGMIQFGYMDNMVLDADVGFPIDENDPSKGTCLLKVIFE